MESRHKGVARVETWQFQGMTTSDELGRRGRGTEGKFRGRGGEILVKKANLKTS